VVCCSCYSVAAHLRASQISAVLVSLIRAILRFCSRNLESRSTYQEKLLGSFTEREYVSTTTTHPTQNRRTLSCTRAAGKLGAKWELEFPEATAKYIQLRQSLRFCVLSAS
jgi:hypothetical protein